MRAENEHAARRAEQPPQISRRSRPIRPARLFPPSPPIFPPTPEQSDSSSSRAKPSQPDSAVLRRDPRTPESCREEPQPRRPTAEPTEPPPEPPPTPTPTIGTRQATDCTLAGCATADSVATDASRAQGKALNGMLSPTPSCDFTAHERETNLHLRHDTYSTPTTTSSDEIVAPSGGQGSRAWGVP